MRNDLLLKYTAICTGIMLNLSLLGQSKPIIIENIKVIATNAEQTMSSGQMAISNGQLLDQLVKVQPVDSMSFVIVFATLVAEAPVTLYLSDFSNVYIISCKDTTKATCPLKWSTTPTSDTLANVFTGVNKDYGPWQQIKGNDLSSSNFRMEQLSLGAQTRKNISFIVAVRSDCIAQAKLRIEDKEYSVEDYLIE